MDAFLRELFVNERVLCDHKRSAFADTMGSMRELVRSLSITLARELEIGFGDDPLPINSLSVVCAPPSVAG